MNLEEKAENWKNIADKLLKVSAIFDLLNTYGDTRLAGAYKYNLMMKPDIDIYLVSEEPSKIVAVELLNKFIHQGWWNNYEYGDFKDKRFRTKNWDWLPEGYYLQLKTDFESSRWKVDIWLTDDKTFHEHGIVNGLESLSGEQRARILSMKDARNRGESSLSSYEIYQKVLEDSK